jgi:hypothetical protein
MDVDMNSITGIPTWNNYYNYLSFNPTLVIIIIVIIFIYLILFGSLGRTAALNEIDSDGETGSGGLKFLGIIVASIFVVLVVINGFNYFLNINIVTSIKNFFTKNPEIDILIDDIEKEFGEEDGNDPDDPDDPDDEEEIPEIKSIHQVYNIPDNKYTYNDAKALCKAYGNRLANYKEIESAYKDGADWCNYGWSDDQMALFPTQYDKWEKLQKIKNHENDCGRPGINGGYIDNPNVRFGVNCYGYKPKITSLESDIMKNQPLYPLTKAETKFEKRVDYWRERISDILVSPFNSKHWSKI